MTMKDTDKIIKWAVELQSLSQTAIFYCKDKFDKERFQRIREIAAEMIALKTDLPLDKVKDLFCGDEGYQTPKIDTRAAIFKDDKVLLVRESDGRWTLP
ncbi:MAG: NUDIX hydrolase N-terminal domain-containing protein, partial [Selenomonadaceae bacterium]|nr:NUDIX hydrolase N-terminal domain-containing protein [Selenomonadaceae bacterium]